MKRLNFRKRGKGQQSLLSDAELRQPSDFERMDGVDVRNDDEDIWSSAIPYQLPSVGTNSLITDAAVNHNKKQKTFNEHKPMSNSTAILSAIMPPPPPPPPSNMKNSKRVAVKRDIKALDKKSSSEDVFDDLDSIKDRVIANVDSLDDFMNNTLSRSMSRNLGKKSTFTSFQIDAVSSEHSSEKKSETDSSKQLSSSSSNVSSESPGTDSHTTNEFPIDPKLIEKKGIVIVDPENKNEIYHMDEDNKDLTNKELIIVGQNKENSLDNDDDDETLMSNLTEFTYQYKRTREERMKFAMRNLNPTRAPEQNIFCSIFNCGTGNEEFDLGIIDDTSKMNLRQEKPSMVQNAKMLYKTLRERGSGKRVDVGNFEETIAVCITRIFLGENGNGLKCTYNEPNLSHDFGVRLREGEGGEAVVVEVIAESTAERAGVKIGDVLSFAVPLNNTFQGYEKACDFISRLELIGMRSSYREIFDMFLSKTSSGWPVATVFRRGSEGLRNFEAMPFGLQSIDMNIDLQRATAFFHQAITRCREYDFQKDANGVHEIIRGNIESFIPRPECRSTSSNLQKLKMMQIDIVGETAQSFGLPNKKGSRYMLLPRLAEETLHLSSFFPDARRSTLLTWYTENSEAIIYLKLSGAFSGSGVLVKRLKESTWSAPCSIEGNAVGCGFRPYSDSIECAIFLRDTKDIDPLIKGNTVTLGGKTQKERVLILTNIAGRFCVEMDLECSCKVNTSNDLNKLFYNDPKCKSISVETIFSGKIQSPSEAIAFNGALRRLELPSTMYPHPAPPKNLTKFNGNNWAIDTSCKCAETLEPPFDESKQLVTLRELIDTFENGESVYDEEWSEFDVFAQKFQQMLYDGVTIDRVWPKDDGIADNLSTTKVTLKLDYKTTSKGKVESLHFVTRSKTKITGSKCNFSSPTDLPKNKCLSETLNLAEIVKISQTIPKNFAQEKISTGADKKKRQKRFVLLETVDGKTVPFLARTGKDASLLACGLKLMAERILQQQRK